MKIIILAFIMSLGIMSCAQSEEVTSKVIAENDQKRVSKKIFQQYIKDHPEAQIIDVRTPREFANGNIEGAVNINFNSSSFQESIAKLDKEKPVLIYCHSGGRSGKALKKLKTMDFGTVLELEGGFSNWTE